MDLNRTVPLPLKIKDELKVQVEKVKELHKKDLENGYGGVYVPYALERKYPKAKYETKWQYLFPMEKISTDPRSKEQRRHHIRVQFQNQTSKKELPRISLGIAMLHIRSKQV